MGGSVGGTVRRGVTERRQRDPPPLPGGYSGKSKADSAVCHSRDHGYIKNINTIHLVLSISSSEAAIPTLLWYNRGYSGDGASQQLRCVVLAKGGNT